MKLRLIAVFLILFMAAWLPIMAQQSPAPQTTAQPAPPSAKPDQAAASCCHGKDGSARSLPCCEGQAKDMPCGHRDAQDQQTTSTCCDTKDGKTCCTKDATPSAANCCKGKDAKLCAKNRRDCCDGPQCKFCCDKNTAANTATPNNQACCAAADHSCCHTRSKA
jgi:hypothetical protein